MLQCLSVQYLAKSNISLIFSAKYQFENKVFACKQCLTNYVLCSWKEVKHDNTVTWLAFWNDPISQKDFKYVFLAASSSLKGQSDKEKYEKSRKLKVRKFGLHEAFEYTCTLISPF